MDAIKYLKNIITPLVDYPDKVFLTTKDDDRGTFIDIVVDPADVSRIIGKSGSTVGSIRILTHILGFKEGKNISLKINGGQGGH